MNIRNFMIKTSSIATSIILLVMAATFLVSSLLTSTREAQNRLETVEVIQGIQETLAPYDAKDSLYKVVIIQDFGNSAQNGEPTSFFEKKLSVNGIITGGYLYVVADVNKKALTQYDRVYLKLINITPGKYREYGGHIAAALGLETPKSDTQTELLFDLSSVKYRDDISDSLDEVISGNWLSILNDSQSSKALGFSSTEGNGQIKKVVIFYKCLEGVECSISTQ